MNTPAKLAHRQLRDQVERLEKKNVSSTVHFANAVLGVDCGALDCHRCRQVLPQHIEAELNHRPHPEYRQVRRHVDLCPACSDAYLDMLEVALAAEEGPLPAPALPIDLSFLEPPSRRESNA